MANRRQKTEALTETADESTYELDLSPMLALMVTLIPIMLLATVFVKVTIVESALPQVVQKAIEEDRNKKNRDISIQLAMNSNKTFAIDVLRGSQKINSIKVRPKNDKWNYDELHDRLVALKVQNPKLFRVDFSPDEKVSYEDIVKTMDEARNTKSKDPKLYIEDPETKKKVETNVMFPDMIFSNVVGG